jgi:hypothetical protein
MGKSLKYLASENASYKKKKKKDQRMTMIWISSDQKGYLQEWRVWCPWHQFQLVHFVDVPHDGFLFYFLVVICEETCVEIKGLKKKKKKVKEQKRGKSPI